MKLIARHDRRGAEQGERDGPEGHAVVGRVGDLSERRVAEPAGVERAAEREAAVEKKPAEQEQPVAQGVHARERHVARADLQRHDVVGEPDQHRHREQEDHRRAVHREDLVVLLGRQHVHAGPDELRPHEHREAHRDEEEQEARSQIEDADPLVVGRREPGADAARAQRPPPPRLRSGQRRSLELLQVGDELLLLLQRERDLRHLAAGLDRLRVLQPLQQVLGRVGQRVRADAAAAAEVREVGGERAPAWSCPAPCGSRRRRWSA